ncbi:DUF1345 domain-containing protein [Weissella paramesenteroides]
MAVYFLYTGHVSNFIGMGHGNINTLYSNDLSIFSISQWTTQTKRIVLKGIRYPLIDLLVILAGVMSVVIVVFLLNISKKNQLDIIFCIFSIFLSWNSIQLLYTVHYAEIYYKNGGGVTFNNDELPNLWDFLYLAYTIGMTYQVSDNNFSTTHFRKVALGHALISFVFSTMLIAIIINFVAGLITG